MPHVLLLFQAHTREPRVDAEQLAAERTTSLTVACIAPSLSSFAIPYALMAGATSVELEGYALQDAARALRRLVRTLPAGLPLRHCVYHGWRNPCLLTAVRRGDYDGIVLSEPPPRSRDLRAIINAARDGGAWFHLLEHVDQQSPRGRHPIRLVRAQHDPSTHRVTLG